VRPGRKLRAFQRDILPQSSGTKINLCNQAERERERERETEVRKGAGLGREGVVGEERGEMVGEENGKVGKKVEEN
jgi:hypothetical protein